MKRRSFIGLLGLGSSAAVAGWPVGYEQHSYPTATSDEARQTTKEALDRSMQWTFRKEGAIQARPACDLCEVALEDAIIALVLDAKVRDLASYMIVVPTQQVFTAAKLVAELKRLRADLPPGAWMPMVSYRIEESFSNCYEWGIIGANGRCWYSPGA